MNLPKTNPKTGYRSERGNALVTVVILCGFTVILLAAYLSTTTTQSKMAYRATLQNEARNASEGMAEYALAEMNRRANANPSFGSGTNPLAGYTLSAADTNFLAPGTGNNHIVAAAIEFKNSAISDPPSGPMLIDPADPVYTLDTDAGKTLTVRSINIYGKATAFSAGTNATITSYVAENVQIREESWLNYAIFYNMDMEFHAGPNFTVLGPVHTNASAYLTEGSGNSLQFFATLTAFQRLYRYDKYTGNTSGGHDGTGQCISAAGMLAANLATMATTEDSTNINFRTLAQTKWKGFVQDQTFSVTKFNPPGLPAYVPEDFSTAAVELRNNAYLMIEPQLSNQVADLDYNGQNDYGQKLLASENLKFSALSGFVIQVSTPAAVGAQPKWKLVVYQPSDVTHPLSANNPPARNVLTGKPIIALTIDPFNDKDDVDFPAPSTLAVIKRTLKKALLDAIVTVPYRDAGTTAAVWGNGYSNLTSFTPVSPATATAYYPLYDRRQGYLYPGGTGSTTNGLAGAMHVLRIDLGKLNALLNDNTGMWLAPYGSASLVYDVAANFTGVVYAQFPLAPIDVSRFPVPMGATADGDQLRPAQAPDIVTGKPGYALLLANGGALPQLATAGAPDGFTVATNGPAYIFGNYNADGNSATGSSTAPDSAVEVPAMIAADSITVLSANAAFNFRGMALATANAAAFTEISAAMLTGLVPTHPGFNNIWSGGVHNLVRFLENWGGCTYRYRGSIAALFESEVSKKPYQESYQGYWYSPPDRDIGYHQYLSQGRFPPATPVKRTIRRMSLQDISAATYNAGPPKPPVSN